MTQGVSSQAGSPRYVLLSAGGLGYGKPFPFVSMGTRGHSYHSLESFRNVSQL